MKILAIDPGTTKSGLVLWSGFAAQSGVLDNRQVIDLVGEWGASGTGDHLAIEMIASYGMAVGKEVFETCRWIGRFQERWHAHTGLEAELVYRKDIKMHLCGSPRAKDTNIRQALIDRYGKPGTKSNPGVLYGVKSHAWAALAVAIYTEDKRSRPWQTCDV